MGYKFNIEYKSGATNRVADDEEVVPDATLLSAMAHPIPDVIRLLVEETTQSAPLQDLSRQIERGTAGPKFTIMDDLIYRGRKIIFGEFSPLREALMFEYHSTPQVGHPGFNRTLHRLSMQFS